MSPKLRNTLSIIFVFISIAAVIIIAFSNQELGDAWAAMSSLDIRWVCGILLCWAAYPFFDSMGTWFCVRDSKSGISVGRTFVSTIIGLFYSNITPSAAGGQPMQVNSLRKAGVPVGMGTMAATTRFVSNQIVVSAASLILLLTHRAFVYEQLDGAIWAVRLGWIINFSAVPLVLLAAFRRDWIQKAARWVTGLLHRIKIVKDEEYAVSAVTATLDTYHTAFIDLVRSPGRIILQLLSSLLSFAGLFGAVYFVYRAFGLQGVPAGRLITISSLLYVSASYTPLPGASGAQEGGFLLYFQGIFTNGTIGVALLVWRFFTYYLFLIVGAAVVLLEKFLAKKNVTARGK